MPDALVEMLVEGIERLRFWQLFDGMEGVGAFALCTDDELTTLVACAAPTAWLKEHEAIVFWPPDWPIEEDNDDALDLAGDLLEQRYRAAVAAAPALAVTQPSRVGVQPDDKDISAHIESAFTHYVEALEILRRRGFFARGTILLVFGTTPTDDMLRRGTAAVARLNGDGVLTAWTRFWTPERLGIRSPR